MALARADAWVRAFTLFGEPSDARAEETFKADGRLSAAGSISAIRDELQLRSARLRIAEEGQGMPWHLEIERSLNSALNEGVLRLRQQRIMSKNAESLLQVRSPAVDRANGATKERTSAMVVFGSSRPVTIVRGAGTPQELRWETRMGGDFDTKALFQSSDRVVTGDELHCDVFDQPRLVLRVKAVLANSDVAYWEAPIIPVSEWNRFQERNKNRNMYIYQPYPRIKYHWGKESVTVKNAEEEAALGEGWADNPAAFDWTQGNRTMLQRQPDPLKWTDEWTVPGLCALDQNRIKGQLLKAHAAFLRLSSGDQVKEKIPREIADYVGLRPVNPFAHVECMQQAFRGIADVLYHSGILTRGLLQNEIRILVSDTAIAAGWWPRPVSECRTDLYTVEFGHYWFWAGYGHPLALDQIFAAETTEWMGILLETPVPEQTVGGALGQATSLSNEPTAPVPFVAAPSQSEPVAVLGAESRLAAKQQAKRKKIRSAWIDLQRSQKQWTSDGEIVGHGGPTYNTIRRYRSGQESTRDPYVRGRLATAFACDISEVPK